MAGSMAKAKIVVKIIATSIINSEYEGRTTINSKLMKRLGADSVLSHLIFATRTVWRRSRGFAECIERDWREQCSHYTAFALINYKPYTRTQCRSVRRPKMRIVSRSSVCLLVPIHLVHMYVWWNKRQYSLLLQTWYCVAKPFAQQIRGNSNSKQFERYFLLLRQCWSSRCVFAK